MTRTLRIWTHGAATLLVVIASAAVLHGDCRDGDLPCLRKTDPWFQRVLRVRPRKLFIHDEGTLMQALDEAGLVNGPASRRLPLDRVGVLRDVAANAAPLERRFFLQTHNRTCAVVGSAGNLTGAGYAVEIDAHDVVFRMNDAPVRGFESTVGRKTTFRVLNSENTMADGPDEILIQRSGVLASEKRQGFLRKKAERILLLDLRIIPKFRRFFPKDDESTGVVALLMAVNTCGEVDAYGFGANRAGEYDYYYPRTKPFDAYHDKGEQEKFLKVLADRKIVRVHPGAR